LAENQQLWWPLYWDLSFTKNPSGADSRHDAESAHYSAGAASRSNRRAVGNALLTASARSL
jgi:hypothetical protein